MPVCVSIADLVLKQNLSFSWLLLLSPVILADPTHASPKFRTFAAHFMSDPIKHECGIALIRLLKPLSFYHEKYGSALYGLKKMYMLMEKQHNRGQDGAGVGAIKFDPAPGESFIFRERGNGSG